LNIRKTEKEDELARLTEEKESLERRLTAAKKLIEGLKDEEIRWNKESG